MSYLVNYGTWKKLFEEANQNAATLIENAKKSDEGTDVPSKPAYEPLFAWFTEFAPKGAKSKYVGPDDIAKMLEYWAGDSSRKENTTYEKLFNVLELFKDSAKLDSWMAAVGEASGQMNSYGDGLDFNKIAENSKKLYDALKKREEQGWIFKNTVSVGYSDSPPKGDKKVYLGYRPMNFNGDKIEKTKARQWDEGAAMSTYKNFVQWQKYFNENIDDMLAKISTPEDETIFYRGSVQMRTKDKATLLDVLQLKAEKYVSNKKAKYDTAKEAIENAYKIRISPTGKIEKTEKTEVISEPSSTTTTATFYRSIANQEQAKGMFANNQATFVPGFVDTLINEIVTSINDVKNTEGFSKFTSIVIKPIASTNVIPTTFNYKGKSGNEALAQARMDALVSQIINPALAKLPDVKSLAKVDTVSGLAPNNSNETLIPGSSKWVKGGNVDDPKYAEFRYSTVDIEVTYETAGTSTTPGESIETAEYAGQWKIEIAFEESSKVGGGPPQQRIPRRFLNKKSPDTVGPCKDRCAAYD